MDFADFLGSFQYSFDVDAPYINVRTIETMYVKKYGNVNQRAVFANWMVSNHLKIHTASAYINKDAIMRMKNAPDSVHPIVALMFAFDISPEFAISTITLFCSSVNIDVITRYMDYVAQTNAEMRDKDMRIMQLQQQLIFLRNEIDVKLVSKARRGVIKRIRAYISTCLPRRERNDDEYTLLD